MSEYGVELESNAISFSPGALESLGNEIVPNTPPAAASTQYRKSLATSLFYKVGSCHAVG